MSHLSAAVLHGFSVLDLPDKPHITVPRGQHRRLSSVDCELHWADDVPSDGRLTGKLRTVLDCIVPCRSPRASPSRTRRSDSPRSIDRNC